MIYIMGEGISPDLFETKELEVFSESKDVEVNLEVNLILRLNGKEIQV